MFFNSIEFALFLPLVFLLYWALGQRYREQNMLIVGASFVFYGWWDWRFLGLLLFSSLVDFFIGLGLKQEERANRRKLLLFTSLFINLGLLGVFKYYNFFIDNFVAAFTFFGYQLDPARLDIVLPVGISFYTFQTLSYSIDVYRKQLQPTNDLVSFLAYVSFFPQLVAGPIERATHLLPQFYRPRHFDYAKATDGLRQILWGLFKKVVIADNCAHFANIVFNQVATEGSYLSGSTLVLGAVFFAFQIYGDFSGYSDIALGTSRLFGFDLMRNFAFPYFSRDIAEFWRRWHISLSTWFRDYVYIPLGGSQGGKWMRIRNTFIIFLLSGFWHGANWTFIVWGTLNALYFLPLLLLEKNRSNLGVVAQGRMLPSLSDFFRMSITFALTCLAWIFFRAENIDHALHYLSLMASPSLFSVPSLHLFPPQLKIILLLLVFFLMIEWLGREQQHALQALGMKRPWFIRYAFYYLLLILLFFFKGQSQDFIYFQF